MRKVYILEHKNHTEVGIAIDGQLQHFYRLDNNLISGSIILGKVSNIKKTVGIFVDINREKNGLLPFRENLKVGDIVCVQVVNDEQEDKGCRLTEKLTLAGRYVVLNDVGEYKFSQKIEQDRKMDLASMVSGEQNVGFIFRSACQDADNTQIKEEMEQLVANYKQIIDSAKNNYKISVLYAESSINIAKRYAYSDQEIVIGFEQIKGQLHSMHQRVVEVDGVQLVFDKTEAMTVVDINSKRFNKQFGDIQKSNFAANCMAIVELARQIRLRNIGGIIIVDLISIHSPKDKQELLSLLQQECKKDNVMVKIEMIESLCLFAINRKQRYLPL